MKVRHGVKDKLLWVGDSVSSNVSFASLALDLDMDIHSAKAYSVTAESVGAKFPAKNFLDVVEKELDKRNYKVLVLGGGTVEITNLDANHNPEVNLTRFKEEITSSSQKMFALAESALQIHNDLEKVIILRRPPRFDPITSDPLQIKPQLSSLGDATLFDLWCNSSFRNQIIIGEHQIPHLLDDNHPLVYGHPQSEGYDGIHMYGPKGKSIFQASVAAIMKKAGLISEKVNKNPPAGRKVARSCSTAVGGRKVDDKSSGRENGDSVHGPNQEYNPMEMLKERISSRKQSLNQNNDGVSEDVSTLRPTVIRSSCLQNRYTVPVGNTFDMLGN